MKHVKEVNNKSCDLCPQQLGFYSFDCLVPLVCSMRVIRPKVFWVKSFVGEDSRLEPVTTCILEFCRNFFFIYSKHYFKMSQEELNFQNPDDQ